MKLKELTNQVIEGMLRSPLDDDDKRLLRDELRARGVAVEGDDDPAPAKQPRGGSRYAGLAGGEVRTRGRMNKTEASYAEHLEAQKQAQEILDYTFERVKLRLTDPLPGERAVWFTGDFLILDNDRQHWLDDVKGSGPDNDASVLRVKTCHLAWPWWKYRIVRRRGGAWQFREL